MMTVLCSGWQTESFMFSIFVNWSAEAIPNPFNSVRAKLVSLSLEKVASSSKKLSPPKSTEKSDSDEIRNNL